MLPFRIASERELIGNANAAAQTTRTERKDFTARTTTAEQIGLFDLIQIMLKPIAMGAIQSWKALLMTSISYGLITLVKELTRYY